MLETNLRTGLRSHELIYVISRIADISRTSGDFRVVPILFSNSGFECQALRHRPRQAHCSHRGRGRARPEASSRRLAIHGAMVTVANLLIAQRLTTAAARKRRWPYLGLFRCGILWAAVWHCPDLGRQVQVMQIRYSQDHQYIIVDDIVGTVGITN